MHAHNVTDVWRGSVLEEQQNNAEVAHERGYVDGCQPRLEGERESEDGTKAQRSVQCLQ